MEIDVDYPDKDAERKILFETTGAEETRAKAAMTAEDLMAAQRLVRRLPVGESVVEAILALVRSARPGPEGGDTAKLIAWGPSPRASQALMLAGRARALCVDSVATFGALDDTRGLTAALISLGQIAALQGQIADLQRTAEDNQREIKRLAAATNDKGTTLIPLSIYFKDGRAKVELGVARGKQAHDKRQTIKKKEMDRDLRKMTMKRG